jgi:putative ABC transport system permease protein
VRKLVLRVLVLLYPRDFRRRFGEEMVEMMGRQVSLEPGKGGRGWMALLRDTVRHVPEAHWTVWRERLGRSPAPPIPEIVPPRLPPSSDPWDGLGSFFRDLRFATRFLLRRPGFTAVALLTLTVGIGANTAVFSLLHTVLFEPLPFQDAEELVYVQGNPQSREPTEGALTYPDVREWPGIEAAFRGIATFGGSQDVTFRGQDAPERIRAAWISHDLTEVLGTSPILGRGFEPESEMRGTELVVLIGQSFWRSRLGSDPDIIGKTIDLGEARRTVVGVMPDHFRFPDRALVWFPQRRVSELPTLLRHFTAVARLAPGVSVEQSGVLLRESLRSIGGPGEGDALRTVALREWIFGGEREPVLIFYAVVSLVLLVASVNVAALFLARNETRRQELAVRASLGAGRSRIIREVLSETLLLAGTGGMLGAALGWYGRDLILAFLPEDIPPYFSFDLRPGVLLFFAGIVTASGLLFGLIPAITTGRFDIRGALASRSRRLAGGPSRRQLWTGLVTVEITLALAVLISANLMVKSAVLHHAADTGFDSRGVVTLRASPPFEEERLWEFYQRVTRELEARPGFTDASLAWRLPTGENEGWWAAYVEGWQGRGGSVQDVHYQRCGPDYFATLGIPVLEGREFAWSDDMGAPRVVAVNRAFSDRYWPGESPVGKRLGRGGPPDSEDGWFRVVALVGNNHNEGYGRPAVPQVYLPFHQSGLVDLYVMARSTLEEEAALQDLRETIRVVDPTVPLTALGTLDRAMGEANWQVPFSAWAFGLLSLIALVLAATGVYGLVAFTVTQRAREFAVRVAVGASRSSLSELVLRESLFLVGGGVLAGLAVALGGMRLVASLLFGVTASDPVVYGVSAAVMTVIVLLASFLPTRNILRMEPMEVLGRE